MPSKSCQSHTPSFLFLAPICENTHVRRGCRDGRFAQVRRVTFSTLDGGNMEQKHMSEKDEVMMGVCTADAETLKRVNAVLKGKDRTETDAKERIENLRLVKITEAKKILGVARQTVYNLIKQGRLETVDLNGVQRVRMQSIVDFANGSRAGR